jgi:hypothetical protein
MHALRSLAELLTAYVTSPIDIKRDAKVLGSIEGFPHQPVEPAEPDIEPAEELPAGE